ncbi:MAG: LytTR family transcriptional regulator DNA-binding domain-containing protein [Lachnospiraceae bacterium]|nr:LytTR family transcriptional regulator DNA-binding domain-containing protein [Lachnospiraceae bacterium]
MSIEPIRTIVVDDDHLSAEATMNALKAFPFIKVTDYIDNSPELMSKLPDSDAELLILDIEMPHNNGLNVASFVKRKLPKIEIIFCTGHAYFAADCYDFEPIDFVTKPLNTARLQRALERAQRKLRNTISEIDVGERQTEAKSKKIGINVEGGYQILDVDNILYIEKRARKIYINTKGKKSLVAKYNLTQLEEILAPHNFFRCHQSFIVPIKKIRYVKSNQFGKTYSIILKESYDEIPLSRGKHAEMKEKLESFGIKFV